ncbi:hypothetical protein C4D60_Mb04t19530 [Musa balbisiana]|uniref:Uncharacterized protein n=1 Tax=Musa balbisiana TaxID=52838 RepID=A0A4S8KDC7_MUSBA|nr:hypothetical protein C4D60_Mb04t19530 [Musa balbisiana]
MQGFPGPLPDLAQLQSTMVAIERACSLIQMHMNPAEAEKIINPLRQSSMPYQTCRFILDPSRSMVRQVQILSVTIYQYLVLGEGRGRRRKRKEEEEEKRITPERGRWCTMGGEWITSSG